MFIIQTNRTKEDFQSYMYEIKDSTWDEFKSKILSKEYYDIPIKFKYDNFKIHTGNTKKKGHNIVNVLINDDRHLSIEFEDSEITEYMLVNKIY